MNARRRASGKSRKNAQNARGVWDWGKVGAMLAGVGVVTAIAIGWLSLWLTGAFNKSDVSVQVGVHPLVKDDVAQVFVAAGTAYNIEDKIWISVNLSIANAGDTVLSNVRITLAYDKQSFIDAIDLEKHIENHGSLMPGDIREASNEHNDDGRVYTNFAIAKLNIKGTNSISYGLEAYRVDMNSEMLVYGPKHAELEIEVEADGVPKKSFKLDYHVVADDGCADLIKMYNEFYKKLGAVVLGRRSYTDYLICPGYHSIATPGGRIWIPAGGHAVFEEVARAQTPIQRSE